MTNLQAYVNGPRYGDLAVAGYADDSHGELNPPLAAGGPWAGAPDGTSDPAVGTAPVPKFITFVLFCLGCATGFSNMLFTTPHWAQGSAIIVTGVLLVLYLRRMTPVWALFTRWEGLLVCLSSLAAILSALMHVPNFVVLRYVLIAVAFSYLLALRDEGEPAWSAARRGLTWAGVFFVLYHVPYMSASGLVNRFHRLDVFLNPNSSAYIAAMTAVSLTDYILSRWSARRFASMAWLLAGLGACVLLMLATKSRSGALTYLMGAFVLVALRARPVFVVAFLLLAFPAWMLLAGGAAEVGEVVADIYSLNDPHRNLSTLTGRTHNWQAAVDQLFQPSPIFGSGPGSGDRILIHNGMLHVLCETGLVGATPLIALLAVVAIQSLRVWKDRRFHFAIALFAAGVLQSLGNPVLFSIGNPAGLLFLLSLGVLAQPGRSKSSPYAAVPAEGAFPVVAAGPYGDGYSGDDGQPGGAVRWA